MTFNLAESGLLVINKPSGITSYGVVRKVKHLLQIDKVGHCGTLDPMAEGVLLVLFGSSTKMQSVLMGQRKVYRTVLSLGVRTDTGDITGKIIEKKETRDIQKEDLLNALKKFSGEIRQLTPHFSAVKVNGKKMYELAREGITVERPPRIVNIHEIELRGFNRDEVSLRVECSSGTYIRTLCEDIGEELGMPATMKYLCREKIGNYDISAAIALSEMDKLGRDGLLDRKINLSSEIQNANCKMQN
ncbi:MAG: tRNA pseudouridine(55) synthase TruB [Elusimicrobia bacterium]|nr:tRNA pseudouridine(55) synthase TruB [Candidatus Liberimonas magnetica]